MIMPAPLRLAFRSLRRTPGFSILAGLILALGIGATTAMFTFGAVLLIVCINLMNLMLVRSTAQRRQWAIRLEVGAAMRDVLQGAFMESLLLGVAGSWCSIQRRA